MKEKILAQLKAKFPKVKLSQKAWDAIVAKIEGKVKDEKDIEDQITAFDEFNPIEDIAKAEAHSEKLAKENKDLKAKVKNLASPEDTATPANSNANPEPELPADTPEWAKAILQSNKQLADKVAKLESEKTATSIADTVATKLKDVPKIFWEKRLKAELPSLTAENIDAFVSDATKDHEDWQKEQAAQGVAGMPAPRTGQGGKAGETKEASKEELDAVMNLL